MLESTDTSFLSDRAWTAITGSLGLSSREAEVARLILSDAGEATIATTLAISPHTVHTHLGRLYRKLGVTSRCQVAVRIFKQYVELTADTPQSGRSSVDLPFHGRCREA
jgi:DNA-binding CsgD family transcriptional regulator